MTLNNGENPIEIRGKLAARLVAVWVLGWINALWPFLRFTSTSLNYAGFALIQSIPWILILVILQGKGLRWRKWTLLVPTSLLALVCVPFGLISAACSVTTVGGEIETKRVAEMPTTRGTVVVYYIDTGAVGYYGYLVRQQCKIVPGVLAVHDLFQTPDHGQDAKVEPLGSLRVHITASWDEGDVDRTVNLWPLPCLWSRAS